jgi:hypothetical protein
VLDLDGKRSRLARRGPHPGDGDISPAADRCLRVRVAGASAFEQVLDVHNSPCAAESNIRCTLFRVWTALSKRRSVPGARLGGVVGGRCSVRRMLSRA